jgi:hypothetical protein
VVEHLLYLLQLNANNEIVLYSSALSSQIPTSYAANAFNVFVDTLRWFEIIRLCALWDRPEMDKENIPIIVKLVDDRDVIEALVEETRSHWPDPIDEQFAKEKATEARSDLQAAIADARTIRKSECLAAIMNFRHRRLAHSLSQTRREKVAPVNPMKRGDEQEILTKSCNIVVVLHRVVNSTGFSFENSRRINRANAKALWFGCKFNITR